ncbi:MAG: exo-alpha-sialidase, partial [Alistipes sp.]|nr:exo-alpha-sialidase [Alistipes sp.]
PYEAPEGVGIPEGYNGYMMHQRMGFYTAPDGRLLTLAFYGHTDSPFGKGGIGRVVREIYPDGSFGPIYFIRYSSHTHWNESNTSYPLYTSSPDEGFVAACEALLADRLRTLQWYDEDRGIDGFHNMPNMSEHREAVSYFHRGEGEVVGLWKKSYATLSSDNGLTWSADVKLPTLKMAGGKVWGQRTQDGRYAIVYNPIATQEYRYPLAMVTSDDGILFDGMGVVHGEVPPRRFFGRWKDFGPCYVRGIVEGEHTPGDGNMWVAYSVNKEDIWVSRIPLPATTVVKGEVADNFDKVEPGAPVPGWNIYSPKWAPVAVENFPTSDNRSLALRDEDPHDYAKAVRVFEQSARGGISLDLYPHGYGRFDIELTDRHGTRAVRIIFNEEGQVGIDTGSQFMPVGSYSPGRWVYLVVGYNCTGPGTFTISLDGNSEFIEARFAQAAKSLERLVLRTGEYRSEPDRTTPNQEPAEPLPGADVKAPLSAWNIDNVFIKTD